MSDGGTPIESGLDPSERATLESFVGKKLYAYSKAPNAGDFGSGDWRDDEPLLLTFEDGTVLKVRAGGWHDSGSLWVERA